jgi:hypothetical protein
MPLHRAAARIRSGLSPAKTCLNPWPAAPIRASSPTWTSSRKTVNWRSGETSAVGIGWRVSPAASVGTTNSESPPWTLSSRATSSSASHSSAAEM